MPTNEPKTASLTLKNRPRADGSVRWFLWVRRPRPLEDSFIDAPPALTRREDRPAVEAWAATYRAALAGNAHKPKPETLDGYFDRYTANAKKNGSTDADKKASRWRKWISPRIGHKRPEDVTRADVEDVRDALDVAILAWVPGTASKIGTAISGKTAMNVWTALTSTFKEATSSKLRDLRALEGKVNPCVGVKPPGDRRSRRARRKTFLYPREAATLLACHDVPREWREVYALALYTFLRPGELRVLRWSDVDLDAGLVHVSRAWDYQSEKVKETPKTDAGLRAVPIEPALRPLLERMRKGQPAGACVVPTLGDFGDDHLARLFQSHMTTAKLTRTALTESTHTHVQANFRSCRDSGITWLALRGLDAMKIKRRAGHDKVDTTDGYIKLAEDHGGDLGEPFGPLPASLTSREPSVNCEPSDPLTPLNQRPFSGPLVPVEGFETAPQAYFTGTSSAPCEPAPPTPTAPDEPARGRDQAAVARLTALARVVERLADGDLRTLASELRAGLEALGG